MHWLLDCVLDKSLSWACTVVPHQTAWRRVSVAVESGMFSTQKNCQDSSDTSTEWMTNQHQLIVTSSLSITTNVIIIIITSRRCSRVGQGEASFTLTRVWVRVQVSLHGLALARVALYCKQCYVMWTLHFVHCNSDATIDVKTLWCLFLLFSWRKSNLHKNCSISR